MTKRTLRGGVSAGTKPKSDGLENKANRDAVTAAMADLAVGHSAAPPAVLDQSKRSVARHEMPVPLKSPGAGQNHGV